MYKSSSNIGDDATGNNEFVEVNSDSEQLPLVGADLDEHEHLSKDMFTKAQSVLIDIDITASPAELAAPGASNVWKLMPHLSKEFKQNLALKNRHLASGDELAGNLNRCIPLHLEILQQKNSFPYAMGVRIPGMMDKNLHRHGQCVYRVAPDTPTMLVGQSAFEPNNIVNKYMYNNYRMCTLEDLANDVKFFKQTSKTPSYATVQVGSLAYETLCSNLEQGHWQSELGHIDVEDIFDPKRNHTVQVTERMGKQIVDTLHPVVKEAADSFINIEDFNVEIVRADGQKAFDKPTGIHGEIVGSDKVSAPKITNDKLQTRQSFYLKAR